MVVDVTTCLVFHFHPRRALRAISFASTSQMVLDTSIHCVQTTHKIINHFNVYHWGGICICKVRDCEVTHDWGKIPSYNHRNFVASDL